MVALLGALLVLPGNPASAQEGSSHPNYLPLADPGDEVPIATVAARLGTSSGDQAADAAALRAVESMAAGLEGGPFRSVEISRLVSRMEADPAVGRVRVRLLPSGANAVRVLFEVDPASAGVPPESVSNAASFPHLLRNDRSQVSAIVAGGIGLYSDGNPWFGEPGLFNANSPVAGNLPGDRTSWTEGSLEVGGGFATRVADSHVYVFGALTGMLSWSLGQDVFRDDARAYVDTEKVFAGLFYAKAGSGTRAKLSVGRQTFTLNDGFLVNMVKGSSNAGPRGGTYLGPRLTNDFSVLADVRSGKWSISAFYIDPNELESLESDSRFLGANARFAVTDQISVDGTLLTVPNSSTRFRTPQGEAVRRQGSMTVAGHLKAKNIIADGLFVEGEVAHQFHGEEDISAWAGYGSVGYIARQARWTPSLSYRYAVFSGDDPDTATFERFDAPLSTGLGIWLQGVSFGKLFGNTNLATHRVQMNVAPVETLNLTFDWHGLKADQRNNLGGNPALAQLSSTDIGDELTLSARFAITRKLYLQGVASAAVPGQALKDIGADRTWSTLQLSLYWSL
jgi:hypothetical protein